MLGPGAKACRAIGGGAKLSLLPPGRYGDSPSLKENVLGEVSGNPDLRRRRARGVRDPDPRARGAAS